MFSIIFFFLLWIGLSYSVGSLHRKGIKASEDGETVTAVS